MKKSIKIENDLFLVSHEIETNQTVYIEEKCVNHIIVIDVSGSMSYDLPEIRKNLKNKISSIVKITDSLSIIWFSGKNDAGILKEEVNVNSLKQLSELNEAIDRFLKPVGMTAFAKPLELVNEIIDRINVKNNESLFNLIFMSDGGNNDVPWSEVISALNKISSKLASSTIVEYKYYCDSAKLTQMSEILGGSKINCSDFNDYDLIIEQSLNKTLKTNKKIEVNVNSLYDFAYSIDLYGGICVYNTNTGTIKINEDIKTLYYFSNVSSNSELNLDSDLETAIYAAINVLSDKMQNEIAEKLFYILGDNYHYKMLLNSFGKQKLFQFNSAIKECVADQSKRFPDGKSPIQPVADDAYNLMQLIGDLGDMDVKFYPNHENFNYNRVGRKMVAVGSKLSDADQKRLSEAKTVAEMVEISQELADKKIDIEFKNTDPDRGYSLNNLVWNSERANLSLLARIDGKAVLPKNKFGIDEISTFKYNTFTLIKDGILNVTQLPVDYTKELVDFLSINKVSFEFDHLNQKVIIDLASLPIINRKMIKSISANILAELEWKLVKSQAISKVYGDYKKNLFPKTSESLVDLMGQECADWLKEIGITDFNGFSPKRTAVESTDFYMSVNLITKIKGLSSLPKVSDVLAKLVSGTSLKAGEWLMSGTIKEVQLILESKENIASNNKVLEDYINEKVKAAVTAKRNVMQKIAEIKFALILSKKWFNEFKTFDDNKLSVVFDNQSLDFTFDLVEKEEKI